MSAADEPAQLGRAMVRGSAWMIASRWVLRLIGLVSTVVLARVLTPADFGLVAMAMLVVGAVEVFGQTGQSHALLRMVEPTRQHYDTAWTFSVLIGAGVALILAFAAPVAAALFDESRVETLLWCLALRPLMAGLQNVGIVDLQRALDFRRDQEIVVISKVAGFLVTIPLAVIAQSYWALVVGILAQGLAQLALGYRYSAYRPRFSLACARELWSFSAWTLVIHINMYFAAKADEAVVGVSLGAASMGKYAIAGELASLPTQELVAPAARPLYAVYSRLVGDLDGMRGHYLTALSFVAMLAAPVSTGVALVGGDAVRVVLGVQWIEAAPLMPWLALSAGAFGISGTASTVLLAAGHARVNALRGALFVALLIPTAWLGVVMRGLEGAAMARLAATLTIMPIIFLLLVRRLHIPPRALANALWRPLLAAGLMAGAVTIAHPVMPALPPLRLALEAVLGAVVYGAALGAGWWLAGRPDGPERTVLEAARRVPALRGLMP
ncbi:lipopolysaccharide biosynthesis protein [Elioraea sp.]|uniref:lipopolysaccharide biosynthesis protein n=1 Tax=Elioraea sp. TaxID=2185103 RepID=UPI0025BE4A54|nr:lipopolysaccharide biosynthesis protein [Elioraea sp.]